MAKRILLTGGTGYLGSELVKELIKCGNTIYVLKRRQSDTSRLNLGESGLFLVNIEEKNIESLIKDILPLDLVIHTATNYGKGTDTEQEVLAANFTLPLSILNASVELGIPVFINTDTVLNRCVNRYSLTKKQFLGWGKLYSREYKIRFVNIVLPNIYGPNAPSNNFVSKVTKSFLIGVDKMEFTEGSQKRDFIFIKDVVDGYMHVIDSFERSEAYYTEYQIGTGEAIGIRGLVELIHTKTGTNTECVFGALQVNDYEKTVYIADLSEVKKIGWSPKVGLEEGLDQVIQFERDQEKRNA